MTAPDVIPLDPGLANSEVGSLVDPGLIVTLHPDGIALDADGWAALGCVRQGAARPLHWWEVPVHA